MRPSSFAVSLVILVMTPFVPPWSGAAAGGLRDVNGHLSIGYAKLFVDEAPGGSLSVTAGVDHPVARALRAGVGVGYHLLGSRTVERGSLFANVDYSLFEAVLVAQWIPERLGPVGIVSGGLALLSARAELSTSGGGAGFGDLAVEEVAPGLAVDVTLIRRTPAPVRVGLEFGSRVGFLDSETWTLATARLTIHY